MNAPYVYRHVARSAMRSGWQKLYDISWLHDYEWELYAQWRDDSRREAWLFGRILAKQLILSEIETRLLAPRPSHPSDLQIYSKTGLGQATRPQVLIHGQLHNWSLSIAHSDRSVLVALSAIPGLSIGVDVTPDQAHSNGFAAMWLTPWEYHWRYEQTHAEKPDITASLWAIKEAFYKAFNSGEGFAPRRIEVRPGPDHTYWAYTVDRPSHSASQAQLLTLEADKEVAAIVTVITPVTEDLS